MLEPRLPPRSGSGLKRLRRAHCRGARRQAYLGAGSGLLAAALAATMLSPPAPRLVWNASASSPMGLYRVTPAARIRAGDMAVA